MEAQWFNVAEQAFAQYSFNKKLWIAALYWKRAAKPSFFFC
jgi:hypothetical protein